MNIGDSYVCNVVKWHFQKRIPWHWHRWELARTRPNSQQESGKSWAKCSFSLGTARALWADTHHSISPAYPQAPFPQEWLEEHNLGARVPAQSLLGRVQQELSLWSSCSVGSCSPTLCCTPSPCPWFISGSKGCTLTRSLSTGLPGNCAQLSSSASPWHCSRVRLIFQHQFHTVTS